jgi:hypothetical protein
MDMEILIIKEDLALAQYLKKITEDILPESKVTILQKAENNFSKFSVIILDSAEALSQVPKVQYKDVVVYSRDHNFVLESIQKAETNIILQSADFYEGIVKFFSLKKII